jgi:hypothetical protein
MIIGIKLYMQTKNYFTKALSMLFLSTTLFISLSYVAGAQFLTQETADTRLVNRNRIYSPETRNKNIIDTAAIHTYCNLSKIFSTETEREKCFISGGQTAVQNSPSLPVDLSQVNATLQSQADEIQNLKNRPEGTIVKYVNTGSTKVVQGSTVSIPGKDGRGIVSTVQNLNGSITFKYTDGTTFTTTPISNGNNGTGLSGSPISPFNTNYSYQYVPVAGPTVTTAPANNYYNTTVSAAAVVAGSSTALTISGTGTTSNPYIFDLKSCANNQILGFSTTTNSWDCKKTNLKYYDESIVNPSGAPIASGANSVAIGDTARAVSSSSMAIGYKVTTTGEEAVSFGSNSTSSGDFSVTLGIKNNASGLRSIASGIDNSVAGEDALVVGVENKANGKYSGAIGRINTASGLGSYAIGNVNSVSGNFSLAYGASNTVSNGDSLAIGNENNITGDNSQVIGKLNTINANKAGVFGLYNRVLSDYAYIFGASNTVAVNATNSIAIGQNINNITPDTIQIGLTDLKKLTILQNGWMGLGGRTSPLTSGNCNPSTLNATATCPETEMLRVPGKIVAQAFEVNGAADLAENFPADEEGLVAGTIVQFSAIDHVWNTGGNSEAAGEYNLNGVEKAKDSKKAIGVIATNPGIILGGNTKNSVPVAFSGRVPVRVTAENGAVKKGDKITLSAQFSGTGAKLIGSGQVVGTAMSEDTGRGIVLMLVKNEYIYESNDLTSIMQTNSQTQNTNSDTSVSTSNTNPSQNTNSLCIEEVCLDKGLLKKLIDFINNFIPNTNPVNQNISPVSTSSAETINTNEGNTV